MPDHKKRIRPVIVEEVIQDTPSEEISAIEDAQEIAPAPVSVEETPVFSKEKPNIKIIVMITVVSALVAAFVSGGVYVYLNGLKDLNSTDAVSSPAPSASPTANPIITPSPTPLVEAQDVSEYSVSVLNGSGAIGAAGKAQDAIEKAGFNVSSTGNAANYNFQKTVIKAKKEVSAGVVNQLKEALSNDYTVEVGASLPSSSKFDIEVTVGKN